MPEAHAGTVAAVDLGATSGRVILGHVSAGHVDVSHGGAAGVA
jgi:hypothetical protein